MARISVGGFGSSILNLTCGARDTFGRSMQLRPSRPSSSTGVKMVSGVGGTWTPAGAFTWCTVWRVALKLDLETTDALTEDDHHLFELSLVYPATLRIILWLVSIIASSRSSLKDVRTKPIWEHWGASMVSIMVSQTSPRFSTCVHAPAQEPDGVAWGDSERARLDLLQFCNDRVARWGGWVTVRIFYDMQKGN